MKRLMVANLQPKSKSRYTPERIRTLLQAQVHNMRELGWNRRNIILLSNFDFEYMDIKAIKIEMNDFCFSGSKMWGTKWLFENRGINDVLWASDIDVWPNIWFPCPEFITDVGCVTYSNPKFNGGSIFWKSSALDIINEIVKRLVETKEAKEEPTLNKVFKSGEFKHRITKLDHTFNVGCSGFIPRYTRSIKPVHALHFHPENSIAWEMHALDREGLGPDNIAITKRLETLLRKYYPNLATRLGKRKKKK